MLPLKCSRVRCTLPFWPNTLIFMTTKEKMSLGLSRDKHARTTNTQKVAREMDGFSKKETRAPALSEVAWRDRKRRAFADLSLSSCSAAKSHVNLNYKTPLWFSLFLCTDTRRWLRFIGTPHIDISIVRDYDCEAKAWLCDRYLFKGSKFSIFSPFLVKHSDVIHRRKTGSRLRQRGTNIRNIVRKKTGKVGYIHLNFTL